MKDELLEYFKGDDLAASTWKNKYAQIGETTPFDMHKREAREFFKVEKDYILLEEMKLSNNKDLIKELSEYGRNRNNLTEEDIFLLFDKFKYIAPGGSIMTNLGTDKLSSLSNCFVIASPRDSIAGIMKQCNIQAQIMKYRGGVGYDISTLRPSGAPVQNAAKTSTGAASFMDLFSMVTNTVAQNGRRGALMLSMHVNHPDIEDFITKKQNLSKVTGANISVKIPDDFMKAVENDEDYILRFPIDIHHELDSCVQELEYDKLTEGSLGYYKKVKARELWNKLVNCARNTAEPGIMFIDRIHNYSPDGVYKKYRAISSNPCQPKWAPVIKREGIRTFADIEVGDEIWSEEGWTKVTNKQSSGVKDVFEYTTTAGSFIGTENHKVVTKNGKVEVDKAENIEVLSGPISIESFNPEIVMDGLVLGDGSVHKASNNLIHLYIGKSDSDYFKSEIQQLILKHRPGIKDTAYTITTSITAEELPLTFERVIPERYYFGDSRTVKSFLRGLYSANGSVVDDRITLKSASFKLIKQVQTMLSSIGIRSYYTTNDIKEVEFSNGIYTCKESYDLNISTDRYVFFNCIGFIQDYKMDKLTNTFENINLGKKYHNIIDKKLISTEEVFDITVDNSSHTYWSGGLNVSNCGEIPMGPFDSCKLMHLNLTSFIENPFTDKAQVNEKLLYEISYELARLSDDVVDLELNAINRIILKLRSETEPNGEERTLWENILHTAFSLRRIGIGFTGLGDVFAMMNLQYGSKEAISIEDKIMSIIFEAQLDCVTDLAILRGSSPVYNREKDFETNNWYEFVKQTYPKQFNKLTKYGVRNISWSTVAPTGTVSLLTQTTSGIEPLFQPYYTRRRKCSSPDDRVDFTDNVGEKYTEFFVLHPKFKEWIELQPEIKCAVEELSKGELEELFMESPWYNSISNDINYKDRIKVQAVAQKYTTHAISSTLNLPKDITAEEVSDIYFEAWRQGLKGITIYREGSRSGILVNDNEETFNEVSSVKRPKELVADYYQVKVKGVDYIVIVGLYSDRPYEIFVFKPLFPVSIKPHKGKLIKVKKGQYKFDSELIQIEDLQNSAETVEQKAHTLLISMLLRHRTPLKFVIKTAKKVDDNISSFSSAMCRVLSKYITDEKTTDTCPECGGKIINEAGCEKCLDCGYSKCS